MRSGVLWRNEERESMGGGEEEEKDTLSSEISKLTAVFVVIVNAD